MQLVEQHSIDRQDSRFAVIDPACLRPRTSSMLHYTFSARVSSSMNSFHYAKLAHMLKDTPEFRALPAKVAQWTVRQVCEAWDTLESAICLPTMPA